MKDAAPRGDIFITVTGDISIIRKEHFTRMKDGAIVCNSGHFNVEIDIVDLEKLARSRKGIREYVVEYTLSGGKKIYILGEGRLVNLAAAEGHPAQVMDMSFANQALSAEYIVKHHARLSKDVYTVPQAIDQGIAELKLRSLGITIDKLTPKQKDYLASWQMGT
jgi:adenosylhomocysteinase